MFQQQQLLQNKAQKKQIENQKVQPMKQNPTVTSFNIPDDKPLSPMSMVRPMEKIHIFRKESQSKIDILKTLENYGEQDYTNGTFYGQLVNGKKHGKGLMLMEGRHCEGFWQNDRKHGICREQFDNGAYFEGEYQNGKPQGFGVQWRQNESYEGQWVNGMRHGHGVWKLDNSFYEGEWRFGKIDGHGVYIHNKNKYTGSFKNSLKHGHGVENFANGDVYNGQYCNGNMEGQGTYIWSNGEEYRGNKIFDIGTFRNGVRHGNGVQMKWDNLKEGHIRYEGQFENDKKHGYGVFTWPSGNHYIGNFANNYRHGYGEMYWKDEYYKGQWERGMQHGEGELCRNGVLKKGRFDNNILCNQRSHSMWEQGDESFNLDKGNQSFSGGVNNNKIHKFMPSIGRKPKLIFEREGKTVIMNNFMSVEIPIENDPDFQSIYPEQRRMKKKINNKPKLSQILQEHFKQNF